MRTSLLALLLAAGIAHAGNPDAGLAPHAVKPFRIKDGQTICTGYVTTYELGCFVTLTSEERRTDAGYEIYDAFRSPDSLECGETMDMCRTTITCRCLKLPKKR